MKTAVMAAVYDSAQSVTNDDIIREMMAQRDDVRITAIVSNVKRTETLLSHIDRCLDAFHSLCLMTGKERQWRVIYSLYISDAPIKAGELAEREYVSERTIYNDVRSATETLTTILFGVDDDIAREIQSHQERL